MLNAFFRPILLILLFCSFAEAWPPTYGAEYQFTNNEFPIGALANADAKKPNGVAARAAAKMAATIRQACQETSRCEEEIMDGKFGGEEWRYAFKDGWWFQISWDPGVVEVMTKPDTLDELTAHKDVTDKFIF